MVLRQVVPWQFGHGKLFHSELAMMSCLILVTAIQVVETIAHYYTGSANTLEYLGILLSSYNFNSC